MGDFIPVTKLRKRGSRKMHSTFASGDHYEREAEPVDQGAVRSNLERSKQELASTEYWGQLRDELNTDTFKVIVCLGLGQVCYSVTSRWQTAMLLLLKEQFKPLRCVAYDPLFVSSDRIVLRDFDVATLYENNEGRVTFPGEKTLFFMPHCGRPLFDSVIYANRNQLSDVTIYGNSFQTMFDNVEFENRVQRGDFPALKECRKICEEVALKNQFQYQDVFNDLSVMRFKANLDIGIPDPSYEDDDEIILRRQMEKISFNSVHTKT